MVPGLYAKNKETQVSPLNKALGNDIKVLKPVNRGVLPLTHKEVDHPDLKTEAQHTNFYRSQALPKLSPEHKAMYDSMRNKSQADADAIIALAGGTHKFTPPKKAPQRVVFGKIPVKSNAGKTKTEGFRYNTNKPDRESITKRKKPSV